MTDDELIDIWDESENRITTCRAIADAAAARAIEDLPKLKVRIDDGTRASLMAVAKAVVADCNKQLGKKK